MDNSNIVKNLMTQEDYDRLIAERDKLFNENEDNKKKLQEARGQGDLSENAEYSAAKENEANLAAKIQEVNNRIASAEILDVTSLSTDKVQIGLYVKLHDSKIDGDDENKGTIYEIVSSQQADILNGKLADDTPVGKLIMNKSVGEKVDVSLPNSDKKTTIKIIEIMRSK